MDTKTCFRERARGNRYPDGITKEQFERAHIITSKELDKGVIAHVAIRDLRVVQIFELTYERLAWLNETINLHPEMFA